METFEIGDIVRMKEDSRWYRESQGGNGIIDKIFNIKDPEHGYHIKWDSGGGSSVGISHIYKTQIIDQSAFFQCVATIKHIILREAEYGETDKKIP